MPLIKIQHVPGQAKEHVILPAGASLYEWLMKQDFYSDVVIIYNGKELGEDDELDFHLNDGDKVLIFSQPKGAIGKILSPAFKLVQKVFGFLLPKTSLSISADTNAKESPNNKLTGQTNIARTYQARPDVYGQVRSYPDLIQESLFEYRDNLKYVTEWMNFGIGIYTVENVRYSESTLSSLAGAGYEIYQPGQNIPVIYEGFGFDEVDGQELLGPNESDDLPVESATAREIISGGYAGRQIKITIVRQAEFEYFVGLTLPHPVTFEVNVTYQAAGGAVTEDVKITGDFFRVDQTDDGSVLNPELYYTFYFRNLSGTDIARIPESAVFNHTKFIINDNQGVSVGPVFSPLDGEQLWVHLNAQLGGGQIANAAITLWKVDAENNAIAGTEQKITASFPAALKTDYYYQTIKITPAAGSGRYALMFTRTDNSNDQSILKLEEIHSVRVRRNEKHNNDTLVKVVVRATEQATGSRDRKYNALITRHTISYDINTRKIVNTLRKSRNFADAVAHSWLVIGQQPESSIDLYELYRIAGTINAELSYFDYTFDDQDISLGSRVETICNAARVTAYWDAGVLTFSRDEKRNYPAAVFNRANMLAEEFRMTYDMKMPGEYDGIELEYVSPDTNKKSYIRYRITEAGIIDQEAQTPLKITLAGCRNKKQAEDRALVEVRRLLYSRVKMACKVLADGEYISPGDMIIVADTYDANQQAGYIVRRAGNNFDTSERIAWSGDMWVIISDSSGNPTARYRAYQRDDTEFGFMSAIPDIELNIYDGYEIQSPSRYVIASIAEMDRTRWTVSEKKPNPDGTTSLSLNEYSDAIYQ